jgi:hypothetical protein
VNWRLDLGRLEWTSKDAVAVAPGKNLRLAPGGSKPAGTTRDERVVLTSPNGRRALEKQLTLSGRWASVTTTVRIGVVADEMDTSTEQPLGI